MYANQDVPQSAPDATKWQNVEDAHLEFLHELGSRIAAADPPLFGGGQKYRADLQSIGGRIGKRAWATNTTLRSCGMRPSGGGRQLF